MQSYMTGIFGYKYYYLLGGIILVKIIWGCFKLWDVTKNKVEEITATLPLPNEHIELHPSENYPGLTLKAQNKEESLLEDNSTAEIKERNYDHIQELISSRNIKKTDLETILTKYGMIDATRADDWYLSFECNDRSLTVIYNSDEEGVLEYISLSFPTQEFPSFLPDLLYEIALRWDLIGFSIDKKIVIDLRNREQIIRYLDGSRPAALEL